MRLVLDRTQARALVDSALSAASNDDITPVICGALVSVENDRVRVVCTDRYRAHTALVRAESAEGDLPVIIPRTALQWLGKNLSYFGSQARELNRITVESVDDALHITVAESESDGAPSVSWSGVHTKGNFPPVLALIERARDADPIAAPPKVNLTYFSKAQGLSRHDARMGALVKFTESTSNPNKPGPVYIAFSDYDGVYAEALLQPMVVLP